MEGADRPATSNKLRQQANLALIASGAESERRSERPAT
jgi:hypothetical protein